MVSHPELGSDPPIGSDRESGRDSRDITISVTTEFCFSSHSLLNFLLSTIQIVWL